MGAKTGIEWTDATWNPVRGCTRVSEGCRNCYAERVAQRFSGPGQPYAGLADKRGWTRTVRMVPEHLEDPLRWRKPRRIFVNSMSDLFHEGLDWHQVAAIFAVMAVTPQHTYQVLTKRPQRMRDWFAWLVNFTDDDRGAVPLLRAAAMEFTGGSLALRESKHGLRWSTAWPLPNVWLGVSVEDQKTADERIPVLLQTPAAGRFVSYEPALGPVDFRTFLHPDNYGCRLDWIIAGGESGPNARPSHPDWFRSVRDQCKAAGVPFFMKQHGEWVECIPAEVECGHGVQHAIIHHDGTWAAPEDEAVVCYGGDTGNAIIARVGKKKAGRLLDEREWNEFPP